MDLAETKSLFDYDRWATAKQFEVVKNLNDEQYEKDLGSSHGGIRGTLVHIYGAQQVWFARWNGTSPPALPGVTEAPTRRILADKWHALRMELNEFMSGLS